MPLYSSILLSADDDDDEDNDANGDGDEPIQQKDAAKQQQPKTTGPSASMRLLQDHLMSKKRSKQASLQQQHKIQKLSERSQAPAASATIKYSELDWDLFDEYDPMMPNSYEILQLDAIKAEEQRLSAAKNKTVRFDSSILDVLDRFDEDEVSASGSSRGTAIAPPTTLRSRQSEVNTSDPALSKETKAGGGDKLDGASAAAKIMAKMGFRLGQGLGRNEQGINAPLEVEKSGPSAGRIVQRSLTPPPPPLQIEPSKQPEHSRVLLLQNMVGPGEVDDELEEETKMECTKYGPVLKCLIYEIPDKRVPDDEAVRIFIEFKDSASALKAANELNGRYFGGRTVRASFYDAEKFYRFELGP